MNQVFIENMVTRFAPSPSGHLHLGSARTALFNWLLSRSSGGLMRLRVEDTDSERSDASLTASIVSSLSWLGLHWDGDIVYQSSNKSRHIEVANDLLKKGHAYKCYLLQSEYIERQKSWQKSGQKSDIADNGKNGKSDKSDKSGVYKSPYRSGDSKLPKRDEYCIRFKTPQSGKTIVDDKVQGKVTIDNATLDDLVLLRSDGSPTYMLSVVVDDHDMGITHIVRGVDHLTNAARQQLIYAALSWFVPVFAHIPLIHGSDGSKLSKRDGSLSIEDYRKLGYLSESLVNYLVRLGWSSGDKEIFTIDELSSLFSLEKIGKSAARFDRDKLNFINSYYLRQKSSQELLNALTSFANENNDKRFDSLSDCEGKRLLEALPLLVKRCSNLAELLDSSIFVLDFSHTLADSSSCALLDSENIVILRNFLSVIRDADWQKPILSSITKDFLASHNLKLPSLARPLRVALTGKSDSIGIFDILIVLGRFETVHRLENIDLLLSRSSCFDRPD